MAWFEVDKAGLAATLERRGKSFAIFELVQNAWDAGATEVDISLTPIGNCPYAALRVEDNSAAGWPDLRDAFTMFKQSKNGSDPLKRGRFCLGEKLVIAICRKVRISTTDGTVVFDDVGRRCSTEHRERGTLFEGEIRMTREEFSIVHLEAKSLIPPSGTTLIFNNEAIERPMIIKRFEAKLPTEFAGPDGLLRRTVRTATVEAFDTAGGDGLHGGIWEMGIPVVDNDWPWTLNVQQKIPLGMERDSVPEGFRRALQVAAVNNLVSVIEDHQAGEPWAVEAIADSRISPTALQKVVQLRFGERAVIATPNDPIANATAEQAGCQVVHGGSLSAGAWANVRKYGTIPTTAMAFPTPRPSGDNPRIEYCPTCKRQM